MGTPEVGKIGAPGSNGQKNGEITNQVIAAWINPEKSDPKAIQSAFETTGKEKGIDQAKLRIIFGKLFIKYQSAPKDKTISEKEAKCHNCRAEVVSDLMEISSRKLNANNNELDKAINLYIKYKVFYDDLILKNNNDAKDWDADRLGDRGHILELIKNDYEKFAEYLEDGKIENFVNDISNLIFDTDKRKQFLTALSTNRFDDAKKLLSPVNKEEKMPVEIGPQPSLPPIQPVVPQGPVEGPAPAPSGQIEDPSKTINKAKLLYNSGRYQDSFNELAELLKGGAEYSPDQMTETDEFKKQNNPPLVQQPAAPPIQLPPAQIAPPPVVPQLPVSVPKIEVKSQIINYLASHKKIDEDQARDLAKGKTIKIKKQEIDLSNGLDKSEWDALGLGTYEAFRLWCAGGNPAQITSDGTVKEGDGLITLDDAEKRIKQLEGVAKALGMKPEDLIESDLRAIRYEVFDDEAAANEFLGSEKVKNNSNLYDPNKGINALNFINSLDAKHKSAVGKMIMNLLPTSQINADTLIPKEQFQTLLLAYFYLSQKSDPQSILSEANGIGKPASDSINDFFKWVFGDKVKELGIEKVEEKKVASVEAGGASSGSIEDKNKAYELLRQGLDVETGKVKNESKLNDALNLINRTIEEGKLNGEDLIDLKKIKLFILDVKIKSAGQYIVGNFGDPKNEEIIGQLKIWLPASRDLASDINNYYTSKKNNTPASDATTLDDCSQAIGLAKPYLNIVVDDKISEIRAGSLAKKYDDLLKEKKPDEQLKLLDGNQDLWPVLDGKNAGGEVGQENNYS
ncbi:MAG: hypothetical protein NT030_08205 [Candidatus Saganbacteria bacterium]|nr:hypothetical protein [Candidatus Saganbacteria bacterium]